MQEIPWIELREYPWNGLQEIHRNGLQEIPRSWILGMGYRNSWEKLSKFSPDFPVKDSWEFPRIPKKDFWEFLRIFRKIVTWVHRTS